MYRDNAVWFCCPLHPQVVHLQFFLQLSQLVWSTRHQNVFVEDRHKIVIGIRLLKKRFLNKYCLSFGYVDTCNAVTFEYQQQCCAEFTHWLPCHIHNSPSMFLWDRAKTWDINNDADYQEGQRRAYTLDIKDMTVMFLAVVSIVRNLLSPEVLNPVVGRKFIRLNFK